MEKSMSMVDSLQKNNKKQSIKQALYLMIKMNNYRSLVPRPSPHAQKNTLQKVLFFFARAGKAWVRG